MAFKVGDVVRVLEAGGMSYKDDSDVKELDIVRIDKIDYPLDKIEFTNIITGKSTLCSFGFCDVWYELLEESKLTLDIDKLMEEMGITPKLVTHNNTIYASWKIGNNRQILYEQHNHYLHFNTDDFSQPYAAIDKVDIDKVIVALLDIKSRIKEDQ